MQSLKYDPALWTDHKADVNVPCKGIVNVRLSYPAALHFVQDGKKKLVGFGSEFRLHLATPGAITSGVPMAVYRPESEAVVQEGVPLTNFDKRPGMSSVERMVKQSILEARLRDNLARKARKEADREANQRRVDAGLQADNPVEPPAPVVEPDPAPNPVETEPTPAQ